MFYSHLLFQFDVWGYDQNHQQVTFIGLFRMIINKSGVNSDNNSAIQAIFDPYHPYLNNMHEFSLAQNIIEIAEETIKSNNASLITEIVLEIGTLSGVETGALDMALESLQPGSVLEEATIKREIVKAVARCLGCKHEFLPDDYYTACPQCGSFCSEILSGKELRVKSITAE